MAVCGVSASGLCLAVVGGSLSSAIQSTTSRATCPSCGRSMPLTKAGLLRVHGPLSNRCEGSGMSPSSPLSSSSRSPRYHSSSHSMSPPAPSLPTSILLSRTDTSIPTTDAAAPVSRDWARYMSSKLLLSIELRRSVRILKRIPRASRHLAASKLACILDEVSVKNDFTSWARLFQFSHRCFAIPTRGSRRRSLATLVNRQLQDEAIPSTLKHPRPGSRPSSDPLRTLAKRVSS